MAGATKKTIGTRMNGGMTRKRVGGLKQKDSTVTVSKTLPVHPSQVCAEAMKRRKGTGAKLAIEMWNLRLLLSLLRVITSELLCETVC